MCHSSFAANKMQQSANVHFPGAGSGQIVDRYLVVTGASCKEQAERDGQTDRHSEVRLKWRTADASNKG
jgi:hypothetical protein